MFFLFVALLLLNACSYFDEEEIKLPGKRVDVFEKKSQKLIKSNKSVILPEPKEIKMLLVHWQLHSKDYYQRTYLIFLLKNQLVYGPWH